VEQKSDEIKRTCSRHFNPGRQKYSVGNNNFLTGFNYPFDEDFFTEKPYYGTTDRIDTRYLTIKFYVDRGLLDHYSTFIYSNDSLIIPELDRNVENGGNDFKLEENWHMIND